MDPSVIMEMPNSAARRLPGADPLQFTWSRTRKGAATMTDGATWTLYPDGTATFRATVTSTQDDDTWVIWHVDLVDTHGAILGSLINQIPPPGGDHRKFVCPMPCAREPYEFRAWADFEAELWGSIARMKMHSSS